jgi:uncharacterized membrane protein
MKTKDWMELTLLAAIWGASFLFMRLGAPEFGAVALAAVRVVGAAVVLSLLLAQQGQFQALRRHWKPIFLVGLTNSGIPFVLFAYAALSITAGLSSIFNASTPLFGAVVAWWWLKDRPGPGRVLGLAVGFAGVLWLAWDKAGFKPGAPITHTGLAVLACLTSTLLYGWSASFTKRYLTGVPPLASATGSQLSSALLLTIPALYRCGLCDVLSFDCPCRTRQCHHGDLPDPGVRRVVGLALPAGNNHLGHGDGLCGDCGGHGAGDGLVALACETGLKKGQPAASYGPCFNPR